MTDTTTETPPPTERTPEQAIEWLGERADRLQQIASNIKQALKSHKISDEAIREGSGIEVIKDPHYDDRYKVKDRQGRSDAAYKDLDSKERAWNESSAKHYAGLLANRKSATPQKYCLATIKSTPTGKLSWKPQQTLRPTKQPASNAA